MSKTKLMFVASMLVSCSLLAEQNEISGSLPYAQTESLELAKAVLVGLTGGTISGYFSAADASNGIHLGNFFIERTVRFGLNDAVGLKPGYKFYSWAASWAGWGSLMLWKSNIKHTLGVGIPTMIGGLMLQGLPMNRAQAS